MNHGTGDNVIETKELPYVRLCERNHAVNKNGHYIKPSALFLTCLF